MHKPFKLDVFKYQPTSSLITKGFLKCVVTETTSPFSSRQLAYCLHCRKLKSVSWFSRHKRKVGFTPSPQIVALFDAKFKDYFQDILTEVELMSEMGRLFLEGRQTVGRKSTSSKQGQQLDDLPSETVDDGPPFVETEPEFESGSQPVIDMDGNADDMCLQAERMVECISDCFEDYCFLDNTFDLNRFASLSQRLLEFNHSQPDRSSE